MDDSNRIVHALWVGNRLSKLELLTISSFIAHGHHFHLWTYSDLVTPLPKGVLVHDAESILPRSAVFRSVGTDLETGVGNGSFAGFSDLFRYKLLYDKGGYWTDMDITCLKPLDFSEPYVFRSHRLGVVGNLMKCPRGSPVMRLTFERAQQQLHSGWHFGNRALSEAVLELGLGCYIRSDICNADFWLDVVRPFIEGHQPIPRELYVIHWINEFWRTVKQSGGYYRGEKVLSVVPDKNNPKPGTTLARLYEQYSF
jgi:Glycosyltransferase sugar-binding region containing DXD motif